MSSISINHRNRPTRYGTNPVNTTFSRKTSKNRVYWELDEMLPGHDGQAFETFIKVRGTTWIYYCGFMDMESYSILRPSIFQSSEWLEIKLLCAFNHDDAGEFNVRVGIIRRSGKEIVASDTEVKLDEMCPAIRLIRRSELNKIMELYKDLEMYMVIDEKNDETEVEKKFYTEKILMDFKEILLSGKNSDFIIRVKDAKFEVHKIILGARSPVFAAMMEHEMKEKLSGEVSIQDADPAVFQEFLFFIYSGREENINWNKNVTELFKLADKYCVDDLRWLCVERMKDYISVENFFDILHISQRLTDKKELRKIIILFFLEESKEIVKNKMWIENYLEMFHTTQRFNSSRSLPELMIQFFLKDSKAIIENENKKWIHFMKQYPEEAAVLTKALEDNK